MTKNDKIIAIVKEAIEEENPQLLFRLSDLFLSMSKTANELKKILDYNK